MHCATVQVQVARGIARQHVHPLLTGSATPTSLLKSACLHHSGLQALKWSSPQTTQLKALVSSSILPARRQPSLDDFMNRHSKELERQRLEWRIFGIHLLGSWDGLSARSPIFALTALYVETARGTDFVGINLLSRTTCSGAGSSPEVLRSG